MKLNKSLKRISSFAFLGVLFVFMYSSCKKKTKPSEDNTPDSSATYDKQAMLVNFCDNLILPSYTDFKLVLDSFNVSYNVFKTSGLQSDFQLAKQKLTRAYFKYQRISLYGFGPAEDVGVRMNFNVFPTDTAQIKTNIAAGNYNLEIPTNIDAKGFPALDYLFYGLNNTENEIVQLFVSNSNRKNYVSDLINEMSTKISTVISSWNTSYRTTFINSLGTDIGSSIGFLTNQINYELDYLKNAKIATPLGLRSNGTALPDNCEAYYSGLSMSYAIETFNTIETIYLGKSVTGTNGKGFDDYLEHLNAQHGSESLNTSINNQFQITRTKLSAIPNPLSLHVISNANLVNDGYKELVKLLVLLKTDLPSSLGVVITYQDGDGD